MPNYEKNIYYRYTKNSKTEVIVNLIIMMITISNSKVERRT